MDEHFFPPPNRPRERGWWRRFRRALAWTAGAVLGGGLLAAVDVHFWGERQESIRLARTGTRSEVEVVHRRSARSGRSTDYYVTLRDPQGHTFERRVARSDWSRAYDGRSDPFYTDPETGLGIAEIERGYREELAGPILLGLCCLALLSLCVWQLWKNLREMRLLRCGVELVTFGGGRHVRITHEGFSIEVRPPARPDLHIRVGAAGGELVALATPDLSRLFFPLLRDVPVERLVHEELVIPLLPPPVRPASVSWNAWLRKKYLGFRVGLALTAMAGAAAAILAVVLGGAWTPALVGLGIGAAVCVVLALAWLRGYWRDQVLWREGDEVHAVVLESAFQKSIWTYSLAFSYRGVERRRRVHMREEFPAFRAPSPRTAPAVTERAVILVDPYRPDRWALVPQSCARSETAVRSAAP